jgi:uncharacterized protein (TIGR02453 family)
MTKSPFTADTIGFLRELAANNQRDWFAYNKSRYELYVLDPALAFIESMGPRLERISEHFVAIPKRSGGSLMRVYRDTRFARDKTPYKTNIGIQFRHERGKDVHAPGFYLHVEPGNCFIGAGSWHPDSSALQKIRQRIAERGDEWERASGSRSFVRNFRLSGETLVRPPRGFDADARHIEDLKRKDFIAIENLSEEAILESGLDGRLARRFESAAPFMRFLCAALELRF